MLKQFQSDLGSEVGSCGASTTLTQVLRLEFYMVCNRLRHTDLRSTQPLVERINEKNQLHAVHLYIGPGFALMHS